MQHSQTIWWAKNPQRFFFFSISLKRHYIRKEYHRLHYTFIAYRLLHKLKVCFFFYLPKHCHCLFCYIFQWNWRKKNEEKKRWLKEDNTKLKHLIRCFCIFFVLSFRSLSADTLSYLNTFAFFFVISWAKACAQVARSVNRSSKQSFYYDFSGYCYFGFFLLRFRSVCVSVYCHFASILTSFGSLFDFIFFLPEHARKGWLFSPRFRLSIFASFRLFRFCTFRCIYNG